MSTTPRKPVVRDRGLVKKHMKQYLEEKYPVRDTRLLDIKESRKKYRSYKSSAKKRGIEFHLTYVECIRLFNGKCYYCGMAPRHNDASHLLGIDRIHPDLAYEHGNTVSCCSACNMAKGVSTADDFISMAQHIALYQLSKSRDNEIDSNKQEGLEILHEAMSLYLHPC